LNPLFDLQASETFGYASDIGHKKHSMIFDGSDIEQQLGCSRRLTRRQPAKRNGDSQRS
jgi:hypothetical protein